jgi:hypothetical protein
MKDEDEGICHKKSTYSSAGAKEYEGAFVWL